MRACIYARTCRAERVHNTTSVPNQIAFCRELARRHNLTIEAEHVFTDVELSGALPPTCWARDDEEARPALSAMIEAIERGEVKRVLVRRIEKLGTTSDVLSSLLRLFDEFDVNVITSEEQAAVNDEPRSVFALSILRPRVQVKTDAERDEKARIRARKVDEIRRLQDRIARLESEIAEL